MIDAYNARTHDLGQRHVDAVGKLAARIGVPFASFVSHELPAPEGIVEVAAKQRCDVIFMATHGRSGLSKIVLGSVTQKVLMLSALPVMIYRQSLVEQAVLDVHALTFALGGQGNFQPGGRGPAYRRCGSQTRPCRRQTRRPP
jgi:hypothetical protein